MQKQIILKNCKLILDAYKNGKLGQTIMPEESNPDFSKNEQGLRLAYFTLPMALNYQRNSYKLWEAALKTYSDPKTQFVFDIKKVGKKSEKEIRDALLKHKLALLPNKHTDTWIKISKTILDNWGSFEKLVDSTDNDFLKLRQLVQHDYKKKFPYLSGPKIFNYWSFILSTYGKVKLKNKDQIDIAPDTHITQCSIKLGVITEKEAEKLSKEEISKRWRDLLKESGIDPIDMHPPFWFWSRNGFIFDLAVTETAK